MSPQEMVARLQAAGVWRGEVPALEATGLPTLPWYLRAMLGVLAWLGGLLLLGAVLGLWAAFMEGQGAWVLGGLLVAAAAALARLGGDRSGFIGQAVAVISLAGQGVLAFAATRTFGTKIETLWMIALICLIAAMATPGGMIRTLTIAAACGSVLAAGAQTPGMILLLGVLAVGVALFWRLEAPAAAAGGDELWRSTLQGAYLAIAVAATAWMVLTLEKQAISATYITSGWLGSFQGLLALAAAITAEQAARQWRGGAAANRVVWLAPVLAFGTTAILAWYLPTVICMVWLALAAFAGAHRPLWLLSLVLAGVHLWGWYYSLSQPLWLKGASLAAVGAVMLGLRGLWVIRRRSAGAGSEVAQ